MKNALQTKGKKEEAMHIEDTERLVTEEIQMIKVVLYLVCCKDRE
jgi:hypothetical protein